MDIGFIGLGKMGFPMARRLIEAEHQLTVFDQRKEAVDKLVALGAQAASSPKDVADRAETVLASLPSLQASLEVATGAGGVIEGKLVKRFVDLSTVGSHMAVRIHDLLAKTQHRAARQPRQRRRRRRREGHAGGDGVGPESGFRSGEARARRDRQGVLHRRKTRLGADHEARQQFPVGDRRGRDLGSRGDGRQIRASIPNVMIDVINAGSGMNTASRDKFPRAILPRTFDFGFATGLMVKDVRLCLEEMKSLGLSMEVAEAVGRLWEVVIRDMGAESDFTSAIKPIEKAAGVVVGGQGRPRGEVRPQNSLRYASTAPVSNWANSPSSISVCATRKLQRRFLTR